MRHMKEMGEIGREHTSDHELRRREFDFWVEFLCPYLRGEELRLRKRHVRDMIGMDRYG